MPTVKNGKPVNRAVMPVRDVSELPEGHAVAETSSVSLASYQRPRQTVLPPSLYSGVTFRKRRLATCVVSKRKS